MVVLFTSAGLMVVATVLVALQQARQEERFVALGRHYLDADEAERS